MRTSTLLPLLLTTLASAQQCGASPSDVTTVDTTSTATVVKTVYAVTHTTTVSISGTGLANSTLTSGVAQPTGANYSSAANSSAYATSKLPVTSNSGEKVGSNQAAQGALAGAILIGAFLL